MIREGTKSDWHPEGWLEGWVSCRRGHLRCGSFIVTPADLEKADRAERLVWAKRGLDGSSIERWRVFQPDGTEMYIRYTQWRTDEWYEEVSAP